MRKVNKILDLTDHKINYKNDSPVSIEICNIRHTPAHFHSSDLELVYCLEGEVNIRRNHAIVTLKKGQLFTIDFEDIHCLFSDTDNLLIMMHIDMKKLHTPWEYIQYIYFSCEDEYCQPSHLPALQQVKNLILAAALLYTKNNGLPPNQNDRFVNKITDILMEHFDWFNLFTNAPNNNNDIRKRFQAISKYCRTNLRKKVTIADLAKTVHINENYLSQFIHKSPYGSFSNMMGFIRCYVAQYLLLSSELSVIEISNQCGFSDDKYFYKHFKYAWRQTPSQFRQWYKDYIKTEDNVTIISNDEAYKILEPYAAEYFSQHILNQ